MRQHTRGARGGVVRAHWHRYWRLLGVAVLGIVVTARRGAAQDWSRYHLTARPPALAATARQAVAAGQHPLDSLPPQIFVYVPSQCVGPRRCPLLLYLASFPEWALPVADKYGMIVLAFDAFHADPPYVDAALRQVFRTFAVDPARLAISGHCALAQVAMAYAVANPDLLPRVIGIQGELLADNGRDPPPPTRTPIQVRLSSGIFQSFWFLTRPQLAWLRQAGYAVSQVINLKSDHTDQAEDLDFIGRWLEESWALSDPTTRPARSVLALDSLPALTADALARMTAFWTRFQQEPDSIKTTARQAHLREVVVPVVASRPVTILTDMGALAAQYPAVAADLKAAGLTAAQHEAYRAALISAQIALDAGVDKPPTYTPWPLPASARLAQNRAFLAAHPDESQALAEAGLWSTP